MIYKGGLVKGPDPRGNITKTLATRVVEFESDLLPALTDGASRPGDADYAAARPGG